MPVSRSQVSPKIEAGLLVEYILAAPERRGQMLLEQGGDEGDQPYFRAADETVCAHLLGIPKQERGVRMKIEVLRALGEYARDKRVKIGDNIAALEAFLEHPERDFLDELETFPGPREGTLRLGGVDIAVCPEIIAVDARTNSFGFVKLRFSRRPLAPEAADHLTAILQAYAQSCLALFNGALNLDLTCVVDVFDGTILRASSVRAGRWGRVREACGEIALNWAMLHSRGSHGVPAWRKAY
jgi:hypothetical protein